MLLCPFRQCRQVLPPMEKKAKQNKEMTSKGTNSWDLREFSIASDLDQVKLLVSLWGLLEFLVFSSTKGVSLCSCKAKRQGSKTSKLLFEALIQYPYASTKLLFLHPLTKVEEMERQNCDQWSVWFAATFKITAFEWVLSGDSVLGFVAKWTTQPVFHGSSPYWVYLPGSVPDTLAGPAYALQTNCLSSGSQWCASS